MKLLQIIFLKFVLIVLLIPLTKALEQPQLIFKSSSSKLLESQFVLYLGKALVLQPGGICSFENLTECHYSEDLYNIYYKTCFKEQVCPRNNYYCINGFGFTVHICGEFSACLKRNRKINVFDESNRGVVDVYDIPCPDGYFQFSRGNCFHACVKDDSIILAKESTRVTRAQGYCNFEMNYCNLGGFISFPLGSKHDTCVDVNHGDHRIHCRDSEDFMPDCSCVPSCLRGQVRTFSSHFVCEWPKGSTVYTTITKGVAESYGTTMVTAHQTSQKVDTDSRVRTTEDSNQRKLDNGQSISTKDLILIVVIAIIAVAVVLIAVFLAYKLTRRLGLVTKKKNKNVTYYKINFHTDGGIQVQFGNDHAVPNTSNLPSEQNCADNHSKDSIHDPQMETLKFPGIQEEDSGVASLETTRVKRLY